MYDTFSLVGAEELAASGNFFHHVNTISVLLVSIVLACSTYYIDTGKYYPFQCYCYAGILHAIFISLLNQSCFFKAFNRRYIRHILNPWDPWLRKSVGWLLNWDLLGEQPRPIDPCWPALARKTRRVPEIRNFGLGTRMERTKNWGFLRGICKYLEIHIYICIYFVYTYPLDVQGSVYIHICYIRHRYTYRERDIFVYVYTHTFFTSGWISINHKFIQTCSSISYWESSSLCQAVRQLAFDFLRRPVHVHIGPSVIVCLFLWVCGGRGTGGGLDFITTSLISTYITLKNLTSNCSYIHFLMSFR